MLNVHNFGHSALDAGNPPGVANAQTKLRTKQLKTSTNYANVGGLHKVLTYVYLGWGRGGVELHALADCVTGRPGQSIHQLNVLVNIQ